MKVGYVMQDTENYGRECMARCLFALAEQYDIEFFSFKLDKIDTESRTITGLFWDNGGFIEKETAYPDIVDDIITFRVLHKKMYQDILQDSLFVYTPLGGKEKQKEILLNSSFSDYVPETRNYSEIDIDHYLNEYDPVIIKPISGSHGSEITKLSRVDSDYLIQYKHITEQLSTGEYNNQYHDKFSRPGRYIVQQYVDSTTKQGNPFDIRIDVRRDKNGQWQLNRLLPRIGNIKGVVSNISKGGFVSLEIDSFLEVEYDSGWNAIYDELVYISEKLPDTIQKEYENMIGAFGIDIGIDRNTNKLSIFEINSNPGFKSYILEASEFQAQYYSFLYNNLQKLHSVQKNSEQLLNTRTIF